MPYWLKTILLKALLALGNGDEKNNTVVLLKALSKMGSFVVQQFPSNLKPRFPPFSANSNFRNVCKSTLGMPLENLIPLFIKK